MNQVLESLPVLIAVGLFCGVALAGVWRFSQPTRCSNSCGPHKPACKKLPMIGHGVDDNCQPLIAKTAQLGTAEEAVRGGSKTPPDTSGPMRMAAQMREQERAAVLRTGCWQNIQQRPLLDGYSIGTGTLDQHFPVEDDTNYARSRELPSGG